MEQTNGKHEIDPCAADQPAAVPVAFMVPLTKASPGEPWPPEWDKILTAAFKVAAEADAAANQAKMATLDRARDVAHRDPEAAAGINPAPVATHQPRKVVDWPKGRWFVLKYPALHSGDTYVSKWSQPDRICTTPLLRDAIEFGSPEEFAIWLAELRPHVRGFLQAYAPVAVQHFEAHARFDRDELDRLAEAVVSGTRQGEANDGRERDRAEKRRQDQLKRHQAATGLEVAGA